jgi:hypothetical protein
MCGYIRTTSSAGQPADQTPSTICSGSAIHATNPKPNTNAGKVGKPSSGTATNASIYPDAHTQETDMLTALGFIALVIGVILVVLGYTVEPRALRPGWGCIILAIILIALGYLLPAITTHDDYDTALPVTTQL